MSSSSRNFQIVRLSPKEEEDFNRTRGGGPGQCREYKLRCSTDSKLNPCEDRVKWLASYDYITGRQGRYSTATRSYCDRHALRFCVTHKLRVPEELES